MPTCLSCCPVACRDDLLAKVREVVSKHPDIMKYETRHAKDGDYKADVMVGGWVGTGRAKCSQVRPGLPGWWQELSGSFRTP